MCNYTVTYSVLQESGQSYSYEIPANTLSEAQGLAISMSRQHGHANIMDRTGNVETYFSGERYPTNG